jgi:hypothetical protein
MFVRGENKNQFKLHEALAPGVKAMLDDVINDLTKSLNARDLNDLLRKLEANKEHYQEEYEFLLKMLGLDGRIPSGNTGPATPTTGPATPTTGPATPTTGPATPTTGPTAPTSPDELKIKYAAFNKDIIEGKNLDMALTTIKLNVSGEYQTNGHKSRTNGGIVAFKIFPNKNYYFKAIISTIGATLSNGGSDAEFVSYRKELAKAYPNKKIDEAAKPITDKTRGADIILRTLAMIYAEMYSQSKGKNQYNPDDKPQMELHTDYLKLFNSILKTKAEEIAASWQQFIAIATQIKKDNENEAPAIKEKPFVAVLNKSGTSFYFGKSPEALYAAGMPTQKKSAPISKKTTTKKVNKPASSGTKNAKLKKDADLKEERHYNYKNFFK